MITIQNLSKRYGNNTVLKDISIQLEAGKIYGLVEIYHLVIYISKVASS